MSRVEATAQAIATRFGDRAAAGSGAAWRTCD